MISAFLLALTICQQHTTEYLRQLLQILLVVIRPPPDPFLDIRHNILNRQIESWDVCDVFSNFSSPRYSLY